MKQLQQLLQTSIVLLIIVLNSYTIGIAIRNESGWGIIAAMGSLLALGYCIHLFQKLKELDADEDYETD